MGKSPGRWIKTVLFGKKYSKSNLSKTAGKTPTENLAGNPPLTRDLPYQSTDRGAEIMELEKVASGTPPDASGLYSGNQTMDSQSNIVPVLSSDAEMRRLDQSVTKAQAAFRGYLARRAFRALKGIIRLQALIRGHLVRRQAVSTLRCVHAIIKFQALARGRRVRLSDTRPEGCKKKYNVAKLQDAKQVDIGANSFLGSEKLATNAFVCKLFVPSRTAVPLSLQYDLAEPNSAWSWLERWSLFHSSESHMHPKNTVIKPQRKQVGTLNVEIGTGKSKRTIRKVSTPVNGDTSALASSETDKPKRNPRKITSHQTELVQQQPHSELERVKRNLRKVSASAALALEKSETETEKPLPLPQPEQSMKIVMKSVPPDVSEQKIISSESPTASDVADKLDLVEAPSKITVMDELVGASPDDYPVVELHSLENGWKKESPTVNEELISKEEHSGKENHKIRKRRSLPVKQEYPENISQNAPSVPSYMAATESAKAKLRAQGSSKFDEDVADYGYVRRHSLPASTNGKLSSLSPRVQKPVQANGKGGSKTNRSLTTSRDDKVLQPGWRRREYESLQMWNVSGQLCEHVTAFCLVLVQSL